MSFFSGTPARFEQRSLLEPEQQPIKNQLFNAAQGPGAGGAFGDAADYYRSLLSDNSSTYNALAAPQMRQFNEQIIPGLSEQFAGMGSGALSSSGFRNSAVNAGTDLSERLGALRAQLRQQGAAGLAGIGQQGLGQYSENLQYAPQGGLVDLIGPAAGAFGTAFLGPLGGAASTGFGNWISNSIKGKSKPYRDLHGPAY